MKISTPRRMAARVIGGIPLLGLLTLLGSAPVQAQERPLVYRVPITGIIELGLAPYVERVLGEAAAAGARLVVLDIHTPGGRVDAAERIANAVSDSEVPVYALINRNALSAGAMVALAAQRIYMRPGSVIGAATPVTGEGETAPEKIVSAMRSEFRSLAQARGLDPRVAEAMVDPDIEIEGVIERGKLLTLSASEAVALGYAEPIEDEAALLAALGVAGAEIREPRVNWAERTVRFLTHPLVAPFLLSLGFLGLLFEVKTPGLGLPGMAGVTFLALFFGSHLILGLAGWEVMLLLGAGIILLAIELLVIPGFGIAGGLGIVAVMASIFLSLIGRFPTTGDVMVAVQIMAASLFIVGLVTWGVLRRLPDDRRAHSFVLSGWLTREEGYTSSKRRDDLAGVEGVATTDLRPAGTARVGEEFLDVVSEGGWIPSGSRIRVLHSEGYRHVVRMIEERADGVPAADPASTETQN
jgi:membrane-bound serine protease (ClpP class)